MKEKTIVIRLNRLGIKIETLESQLFRKIININYIILPNDLSKLIAGANHLMKIYRTQVEMIGRLLMIRKTVKTEKKGGKEEIVKSIPVIVNNFLTPAEYENPMKYVGSESEKERKQNKALQTKQNWN